MALFCDLWARAVCQAASAWASALSQAAQVTARAASSSAQAATSPAVQSAAAWASGPVTYGGVISQAVYGAMYKRGQFVGAFRRCGAVAKQLLPCACGNADSSAPSAELSTAVPSL